MFLKKQPPKKPSPAAKELRKLALTRTYSSQEEIIRASSIAFKSVQVGVSLTVKETSRITSHLMSTSRGRNKICGVIQYAAKLVYNCKIYSNIPEIAYRMKNLENAKNELISGRIMQEMSKGRKIFRFLKFIEELNKVFELQRSDKPPILKLMKILDKISSFFYYILDNFMWGVNTGIFPITVTSSRYQQLDYVKDMASFWRNCFNLMISVYNHKLSTVAEQEVNFKLKMMPDQPYKKKSESYQLFVALIKLRKSRRLAGLELLHSILRLLMLWYKLKFPKWQNLNVIFVVFIGNISAWISLFKQGIKGGDSEKKSQKLMKYKRKAKLKRGKGSSSSNVSHQDKNKKKLLRSFSTVFKYSDEDSKDNFSDENDPTMIRSLALGGGNGDFLVDTAPKRVGFNLT